MAVKRPSISLESSGEPDQPPKKSLRTHEENQERAYIAASRRADRDIEQRMQSARKASECRRNRTGRGLKITREAVMGDEQYESEDEEHSSRHPSLSAGAMPVSNRYDPEHCAMIDALFAEHFPNVQLNAPPDPTQEQHQQQLSQQNQPHTLAHRHSYSHPFTPAAGGYTPRFKQRAPTSLAPVQVPPYAQIHSPSPIPPTPSISPTSSISYPPPPPAHGLRTPNSMSPPALDHLNPHMVAGMVAGTACEDGGGDNGLRGEGKAFRYSKRARHDGHQPVGFSFGPAGAGGEAVWFDGGDHVLGWHNRTPSALDTLDMLEQFQFPVFDSAPSSDHMLIDPDILSASMTMAATDGVGVGAGADALNDPWAEWFNLDGDVAPAMGVKV